METATTGALVALSTVPLQSVETLALDDTHPRVDLLDMRGTSIVCITGRLLTHDLRRVEVALLEAGPTLQVGTRLVLRWPEGRLTGIIVHRTEHIVTIDVRKVHRVDQRTFPRVSGGMRCMCRFGAEWSWPRRLIDLSVGGVLLVTSARVKVEDPVVIMLGLHDDPGPWRLRGRVVRVRPQGADSRVGIAFEELTQAARHALLRHCNTWLSQSDEDEPSC
jgi:hypothetical protein